MGFDELLLAREESCDICAYLLINVSLNAFLGFVGSTHES